MHLNLYAEDFRKQYIWEEVCEVLKIDPNKTDKATIFINKVVVNKTDEELKENSE